MLCILPFDVVNSGDKSAKNVELRIMFPIGLRGGGFKDEFYKHAETYGSYNKEDIKRTTFIYKGYETVNYMITEIGPKRRVIIEEAIEISLVSGIPFDVNSVSKDKVPFKIKGNVLIAGQIDVAVSATDEELIEGSFKIRAFKANNKEELLDKIIEDETKSLRNELRKKNYPENFILKVHASGIREKTIFIIPKFDKISKLKMNKNIKKNVFVGDYKKSIIGFIEPEKQKGK